MKKFEELPTTDDRRGRPLRVENANINSVSIGNEAHGALTAWLELDIGSGSVCSFGGFKLGNADTISRARQVGDPDYMAEWIRLCINVLTDDGLGTWEGLAGKPCRVLSEGLGGCVVAIGHFRKNKWFYPKLEFKGATG